MSFGVVDQHQGHQRRRFASLFENGFPSTKLPVGARHGLPLFFFAVDGQNGAGWDGPRFAKSVCGSGGQTGPRAKEFLVQQVSKSKTATIAVGQSGASCDFPQIEDVGPRRLRIDHYWTPSSGELIGDLSISGQAYRYSTLYALELPALRKGDVVQAHAQFQINNPHTFSVMLSHTMLLHPRKTIVRDDPKQSRDERLCEYAGENVTPKMRNGFRSLMGSFAAAEDGDSWISVVVYAATWWTIPGLKMTVQKGYGGLRAIVYRNP